jgi:uncharacterized RDD family membrane protein YckC
MSHEHLSPLPREARPYQGQRAGLVTRMIGAAIDAAVVGLVLCMGYAGLAGFLFILSPRDFSFPDTSLFLSLAAAFGVMVVYLTATWWFSGRTYGSLLMGLRVVNYNGERMHLAGAFVRAVFCTVFPVGLLWIALSRQNRSVQDVVLRTSVIYDWKPKSGATRRHAEDAGPAEQPEHEAH